MEEEIEPHVQWLQMLEHIFLPRKIELFGEPIPSGYLLELFTTSIKPIKNAFPATARLLYGSQLLYKEHDFSHHQIELHLQNDDFFFYFDSQNSTISIQQFSKDLYKLTIYPTPQVGEKEIYQPKILLQTLPLSSHLVEKEKFSKSFIGQLITLRRKVFDDALPKMQKKGETFANINKVPTDIYIKNWFVPSLNPRDNPKTISIQKKVKDENYVLQGSNWRRDPFYITLKHVFHHQIVQEMGDIGHIYYKLAILIFQRSYVNDNKDFLPWISGSGFLREIHIKMVHRIQKLKQIELPKVISDHLFVIENNLKKEMQLDKLKYNKNMELNLRKFHTAFVTGDSLDYNQSLKNSIPLINEIVNHIKPKQLKNSKVHNNYLTLELFKKYNEKEGNASTSFSFYQKSYLYSIEESITNQWLTRKKVLNKNAIPELYTIYIDYFQLSKKYYKKDAFQKSIRILTLTTITALIDHHILLEYPFLEEHQNHVNLSVLKMLLLHSKQHLLQLQTLENYFIQRNDVKGKGPFDIEYNSNCISVRYFDSDPSLEVLRKEIQQQNLLNIEHKNKELITKKENREKLKKKMNSIEQHGKYTNRRNGRTYHDRNCQKCALEAQIDKIFIERYENLLPTQLNEQKVVLFELAMPQNISFWRDSLYQLFSLLKFITKIKPNKIRSWKKDSNVRPYSLSRESIVSLSSTTASFESGYTKSQGLDSSDPLIVPNGFNLKITVDGNQLLEFKPDLNNIALSTTYHITDSGYKNLDKVVSYPQLGSENTVLACAAQCPLEVNLSDWQTFGSMRVGSALQYHNLFAAFHADRLPFDRIGSVQLIMNTIWQVWVTDYLVNEESCYLRRAHSVLYDNEIFTSSFVNELGNYLERIKDQWEKPFCLINTALVAIRCFTVAKLSLKDEIISLLRDIRNIGIIWIEKINCVLSKALADENATDNVRFKLRLKLCYVSIAIIFTYFTDSDRISYLINEKEDYLNWIRSIICLNRNYVAINDKEEINPFFNLVERISLMIYPILQDTIPQYLSTFMAKEFLKIPKECFKKWKENPPRSGWFSCEYINPDKNTKTVSTAEINCLDGLILINGCQIDRLPLEFVKNESFIRTFGESTIFDVQRDGDLFLTAQEYSNSIFQFFESQAGDLIIVDKSSDCSLYLIPLKYIQKDLPAYFVNNFSHWIDPVKKIIYFRPKSFKEKGFFIEDSKFLLQFISSSWVLLEQYGMEKKVLLNYYGKEMINISKSVLSKIEDMKHIHVWKILNKEDTKELEIELPQYDLLFHVKAGKLYHNHKVVSGNQLIGTLHGLLNYIKLESEQDPNEIELIIPHGNITLSNSEKEVHQRVEINDLLSPPYFSFKMNQTLRRIEGPQSQEAWIYLAYLHAVTSSIYRDSFTGMTGTEQAIHILNLKICKSFSPYSEISENRLKQIKKLSPVRSFVPSHVKESQEIEWPENLPSVAASDAFILIANKLLNDSKFLQFKLKKSAIRSVHDIKSKTQKKFEQQKKEDDDGDVTQELLNEIGYWKSEKLYSPTARISPEFLSTKYFDTKFVDHHRSTDNILVDQIAKAIYNGIPLSCPENFSISTWLNDFSPIRFQDDQDVCSDWTGVIENLRACYINLLLFVNSHRDDHVLISLFLSFLAFQGRLLKENDYMPGIISLVNFAINPPEKELLELLSFILENKAKYQTRTPDKLTASTLIQRYVLNPSQAIEALKWGYDEITEKTTIAQMQLIIQDEVNYVVPLIMERLEEVNKFLSSELYLQTPPWDNNIIILSPLPNFFKYNGVVSNEKIDKELSNFLEESSKWIIRSKLTTKLAYLFKYRASNVIPNRVNVYWPPLIPPKKKIFAFYSRGDKQMAVNAANNIRQEKIELPWIVNNVLAAVDKIDNKIQSDFLNKLGDLNQKNESAGVAQYFINDITDSSKCDTPNSETQINDLFIQEFQKKSIVFVQNCIAKLQSLFPHLQGIYDNDLKYSLLCEANLLAPFTEQTIFPTLLNDEEDEEIKMIIRTIVTLKVYLQKIRRMIKFLKKGDTSKFKKELIHNADIWDSREYPSWLLFELENNIGIYPIQAKVAFEMMNPRVHHSLLQLNMGEGKSRVITPIIASHLAYRKDSLIRVIVLPSLYQSNYSILQYQLGRLLNHQIFSIPCARDYEFDSQKLRLINKCMRDAIREMAIIVTVPEYIKSFRLKYFEACVNEDFELSKSLAQSLNIEKDKARDIIDEADAILHYKSQLVYTLGDQLSVYGGANRWETIVKILNTIISLCCDNEFRKSNEEYYSKYIQINPAAMDHEFPSIRFLSETPPSFSNILKVLIVTRFLKQDFVSLRDEDKALVMEYTTVPRLSRDLIDKIKSLELTSNDFDVLNTLRGFIAFDIFILCFSKRWRVEYGVNKQTNNLKKALMAVPFRGKDVAAERTEYGHPDVAMAMTILSYYHSGLSSSELTLCFKKLDALDEAERDRYYSDWYQFLDPDLIEEFNSIPTQYGGVNLSDVSQKENLFSALRKHILVINFFLFKVVFPKEAKQFPYKIVATSWMHAEVNRDHSVTGFSGTNDTSLLLPLSIKQNDLIELKGTNAHVLRCILMNQSYDHLNADISAEQLIEKLVMGEKKANVLLDVGALVIEMSNEEVAENWLQLRRDAKGVIFYGSESNDLVVLSRSGKIKSIYHYSDEFKDYLVYLDEIHTRGTDLVLPDQSLAVVTLGARLTKDKFVQGCMRMRKLGDKHFISFWASNEVHLEILNSLKDEEKITTAHIINWTISNSIKASVDGFTLWGNQAINHMHVQNLIGAVGNSFSDEINDIKYFAEKCKSNDAHTLEEMYGQERDLLTIPNLIHHWGLNTQIKIKEMRENGGEEERECDYLHELVQKCEEFVPNVRNYAQLLMEEQERELEAELEEEKFTERPPPYKPSPVSSAKQLRDYFISAKPDHLPLINSNLIFPLSHYFRDSTKISRELLGVYRHDPRLFSSSEFCKTIEGKKQEDSALRSPSWCLITRHRDRKSITSIILIAPHEANELAIYSRTCKSNLVSINKFIGRVHFQQTLLIDNESLAIPFNQFSKDEKEDLLRLSVQLSLFAGSLYFGDNSKEEQLITAAYLGVCPRPFSADELIAFNQKLISMHGFVERKDRLYTMNISSFDHPPNTFVSKLYEIRGGVNNFCVSDIGQMLNKAQFIQANNRSNDEFDVKKYLTVKIAEEDDDDTVVEREDGKQILMIACNASGLNFDNLIAILEKKKSNLERVAYIKRMFHFESFPSPIYAFLLSTFP